MTDDSGRANALLQELNIDAHRWEGMLLVVKAGGDVLESGTSTVVDDVRLLADHGARVAFVYGAQNELSRMMRRYGLEPRFVGGLRVTDAAAMGKVYIPVMTRRGRDLAARLSGELLEHAIVAKRMERFGYVGDVTHVSGEVASRLTRGTVAVIPPLANAEDGNGYGADGLLNCNADNVACALAYHLMPDETYLATNVPGVMLGGSLLPALGHEQARLLVAGGYVTGGMEQKVLQAAAAIERGSGPITIFDGTLPHRLFYAMRRCAGTRLYHGNGGRHERP